MIDCHGDQFLLRDFAQVIARLGQSSFVHDARNMTERQGYAESNCLIQKVKPISVFGFERLCRAIVGQARFTPGTGNLAGQGPL